MANHGTHTKTAKQRQAHNAKPSRAARYSRRWDARVAEMNTVLGARDADWAEALEMNAAFGKAA